MSEDKKSPSGGTQRTGVSRRALLQAGLLTSTGAVLAACAQPMLREAAPQALEEAQAVPTNPPPAEEQTAANATPLAQEESAVVQLDPTPECGDDDEPTPAQTEGPFYTPDTPERVSFLEPGLSGDTLLVAGYVLTTDCQPVAGTLVDFWQCDAEGVYDNSGFRLRGHQFADDQGRYQLETIVPGLYPGRTRHIHVRVQPPGGAILTTQLYFPNEPQNATDGIFRPELLMALRTGEPAVATFDFVV